MSDNYMLSVVVCYPSPQSKPEVILHVVGPLEIVTAALHKFTEHARYGVETIEVKHA